MKKNHFLLYLVLLSVGVFLTGIPLSAKAMEGGQVGHQGVIEFYEESSTTEPSESSTTEPTVESSTEPSVSTSTTSSSTPIVQKPTGNYPSTGEVVQRSLMLSGAAILALALLFAVWKKRKEKRES